MNNKELILVALHSIPYSDHISNIDLNREDEFIQFTWRGDMFRVSISGDSIAGMLVESCGDGFLHGDNKSILMEHILKLNCMQLFMNNAVKKGAD